MSFFPPFTTISDTIPEIFDDASYRKEVLDAYAFFELDEVRTLTEQWVDEYNNRRPHEALQNYTPAEWCKIKIVT